MAKILGRATVKMDGAVLMSHPGASLQLGGITRTTRTGNSVHGYSEQVQPSRLECRVSLTAQTDMAALRAAADVTLTFECDTGQTYVVGRAWLTEPPTITDGNDSNVGLIFEGDPAEEML